MNVIQDIKRIVRRRDYRNVQSVTMTPYEMQRELDVIEQKLDMLACILEPAYGQMIVVTNVGFSEDPVHQAIAQEMERLMKQHKYLKERMGL